MYKYRAKCRYMYGCRVRSKCKCESRYEYRRRFKSQCKYMYKFTRWYKHYKYTYDCTRTLATTNRSIIANISTYTHRSAHTITSAESANLRPKAAPAGGGLRRKRADQIR